MAKDMETLQIALRRFADERDWGQFHTPKNLAMSLSIEAAEVLEHFQWQTDEGRSLDPVQLREVGHELADVLFYLLQLADRLDIDLPQAAAEKLAINAAKYPVDKAKGNSHKYTKLKSPRT